MDATSLTLSLLFGAVGMGLFIFGKKTMRMVPMGAGVALMVCPYFITNTVAMLIVCVLLTAVPFVVRDA